MCLKFCVNINYFFCQITKDIDMDQKDTALWNLVETNYMQLNINEIREIIYDLLVEKRKLKLENQKLKGSYDTVVEQSKELAVEQGLKNAEADKLKAEAAAIASDKKVLSEKCETSEKERELLVEIKSNLEKLYASFVFMDKKKSCKCHEEELEGIRSEQTHWVDELNQLYQRYHEFKNAEKPVSTSESVTNNK